MVPEPVAPPPPERPKWTKPTKPPPPLEEWEVDSPRGKRESGRRPQGDPLFTPQASDPWDEKILVSVKEAAWMLSLPESAIRHAVRDRDLDRVYIGDGTTLVAPGRVDRANMLCWAL